MALAQGGGRRLGCIEEGGGRHGFGGIVLCAEEGGGHGN